MLGRLRAPAVESRERDANVWLPVQHSLKEGSGEEVVMELMCVHPESAGVQANDGWLPIHLALKYGAGEEVATKLLELHPEGAKVQGNDGWPPIHVALGYGAGAKVG